MKTPRIRNIIILAIFTQLYACASIDSKPLTKQPRATQSTTRQLTTLSAEALKNLNAGNHHFKQHHYDLALAAYKKALPVFTQLKQHANIGATRRNIGLLYGSGNQPDAAIKEFQQALEHFHIAKQPANRALVFSDLGLALRAQQKHRDALAAFTQALSILQTMPQEQNIAFANYHIGTTYAALGKHHQALNYYAKAQTTFTTLKDITNSRIALTSKAIAINAMGDIYYQQKQYDRALDYFAQSLNIYQELNDPTNEQQQSNKIAFIQATQQTATQTSDTSMLTFDHSHTNSSFAKDNNPQIDIPSLAILMQEIKIKKQTILQKTTALKQIEATLASQQAQKTTAESALKPFKESAEKAWRTLDAVQIHKITSQHTIQQLETKFKNANRIFEQKREPVIKILWAIEKFKLQQQQINSELTALRSQLNRHLAMLAIQRQPKHPKVLSANKHNITNVRHGDREKTNHMPRQKTQIPDQIQFTILPSPGIKIPYISPTNQLSVVNANTKKNQNLPKPATTRPRKHQYCAPTAPKNTVLATTGGIVAGSTLTFIAACGAGALLSPFTGGVSAALGCGLGAIPAIGAGAAAGGLIGNQLNSSNEQTNCSHTD